jgi:hypothetical protein
MSTTPAPHADAAVAAPGDKEIRVYSHSPIFYWWPVWAVGFIMTVITLIDRSEMVVVPAGSWAETGREIKGVEGQHDVVIVPAGKELPRDPEDPSKPDQRFRHMSRSQELGVIYAVFLLVIIVVSNVPLRGLWSVLIILGILLFVLITVLWGVWPKISYAFSLLDIRINLAGYATISTVLFIIWALTVFVFDRRTYVAIAPRQVRLCTAIGAGETVYDTTGMTFQKRQDDLFRHWIIGLGSGDLILHRTNVNQEIDLPNVLFIGAKIREIERLVKEQVVV